MIPRAPRESASVVEALRIAAPSDEPLALDRLRAVAADQAAGTRTLRASTVYPAATLLSVLIAGRSVASGVDVLQRLRPEALFGAGPMGALIPPLVGGVALLGLVLLVLGRVRWLGMGRGWDLVEARTWLSAARALVAAGATGSAAFRGASALLSGRARRRGEALAFALEAGSAPAVRSVLPSHHERFLLGGARAGALDETLAALDDHQRLTTSLELPREAARLQMMGLLLTGASLGAVFLLWFGTYARAILG